MRAEWSIMVARKHRERKCLCKLAVSFLYFHSAYGILMSTFRVGPPHP
jgi:hypothetical protein